MAILTIGKLAAVTGLKVETIRYYEQVGLVAPPSRTASNYRVYRFEDIARLGFIRRTRELGFSLDEVRTLLSLSHEPHRDCATVDEIASKHLSAVDRKITDLKALRVRLAEVVEGCAGGTVAECRILEAFGSEERPSAP